jgi:transposase
MVPISTDGLKAALLAKFAPPPWEEDSPARVAIDSTLAQDHTARVIDRVIQDIDLQPLLDSYSGRGRKAYRPDLLLAVVLFEMYSGRQSPSQWADDLRHHNPVRWLARGLCPCLSVLYEFRDRLAPFVETWHQQVVAAISDLRPEVADTTTLDGTTLEANASRHKMAHLDTVEKHLQQLEQAEKAIAENPPVAENPPAPQQPEWMAKTSAGREQQSERHQHAKERLEEMLERNHRRPKDKRLPDKQVRVSITDPEAASGRDKHGVYRPLYNVQLVWSLMAPVILAFGVFSQAGDHGMLPNMMERLTRQAGRRPKKVLADSAYTSADDLAYCAKHDIDLYGPWQENDFTKDRPAVKSPAQIPKAQFAYDGERDMYRCPENHDMPFEEYKYKRRADGMNTRSKVYRCPAEHCKACPLAATCAKLPNKGRTIQRHPQQELIDKHVERMGTAEAKDQYRQRGQGERPFADLKTHRGLHRLNGRGLTRAKTQTALAVLQHNLQQLDSLKKTGNTGEPSPSTCKIPA